MKKMIVIIAMLGLFVVGGASAQTAPLCLKITRGAGVRQSNTLWSPSYRYADIGDTVYAEELVMSSDPPGYKEYPATWARVGAYTYFVVSMGTDVFAVPCEVQPPTVTPTVTPTHTQLPYTPTPTAIPTNTPTITPTVTPAPHDGTLYVATYGNDNNIGSYADPFETIKKAVDTGTSIRVMPGVYDERVKITRPTIIEAVGDVTTQGFLVQSDDVTIRGFTIIQLYGTGIIGYFGSNSVIEDNEFLYNGDIGLKLSNDTNGWIVRNNRFHRNNTAGAEFKGNNHLVEGNEVTHTIQYSPCVPPTYGADADGFRFHGGGHVFRNNYIHDMPDGPDGYDETECSIENLANLDNDYDYDSHTDCFQTFRGSSNYPIGHDTLFEGNTCKMSPSSEWTGGFAQKAWQGGDAYNITIRNNLVISDFVSLFQFEGCQNIVYDHNTFIGSNHGNTAIKYIDCGSDAGSVKNNIFYGLGDHEIKNSSVVLGYNCVYPSSTSPDPGDVRGLDPRLDSNYHLLPGSPCIGAAEDGSDIGAFQ